MTNEAETKERYVHGPECRKDWPDRDKTILRPTCECVFCWCPVHMPGGFLGTCQRCGRPLARSAR